MTSTWPRSIAQGREGGVAFRRAARAVGALCSAAVRAFVRVGCLCWAALLLAPAVRADELVLVPAGTFPMGSLGGDADERPVRRVTLPAFRIDRTEVTQGAYARCVAAGACRPARRYAGLESAELPAVGVSWEDAVAYCRYVRKRLPTEAEWERAARGTDGRSYPWGAGLDCRRANFGNFDGEGPCAGTHPGRVGPVGRFPGGRSPVGAFDMGGNAWEWVADWYGPYGGPTTDPRGPVRGRFRVVRGGSCCSYFAMPRATNRARFEPDYAGDDVGFRCASSVGGHVGPSSASSSAR